MARCVHCGTFKADLKAPNVMLEMRDDEGNVYHICRECEDAEHESEEEETPSLESLTSLNVHDEEERQQWFADPVEPAAKPYEERTFDSQ